MESLGPDCVLLDVMLPGMTGWEVCHFIRSHPDRAVAETPVIMLTALGEPECKVKGLDVGANCYLPKPYSLKEVLLHCRRLIEEKQDQEALYYAAIRQLRNENENCSEFGGVLFHEMRNQLTCLGGFCSRLRKNMVADVILLSVCAKP